MSEEQNRWLELREECVLLGLSDDKMVDVVPLPSKAPLEYTEDVPTIDGKTTEEIAETLREIGQRLNQSFEPLSEYLSNALFGLWKAKQLAREKWSEDSSSTGPHDELEAPQASFMLKLNLIMSLPLVKSVSKVDPSLQVTISGMLTSLLQDLKPSALQQESSDCIAQLEDLLCDWLVDGEHLEHTVPALVSLTLAVNRPAMVLRTVHHLYKLTQNGCSIGLALAPTIHKLLQSWEVDLPLLGPHLQNFAIQGGKMDTCVREGSKGPLIPSVAPFGQTVYVLTPRGELVKVGTGRLGSLHGNIYCRRKDVTPGWIVSLDTMLVLLSANANQLSARELNKTSLANSGEIPIEMPAMSKNGSTLHVISDGHVMYHVTLDQSNKGETQKVQVDAYCLRQYDNGKWKLQSCDSHVTLRNVEESDTGNSQNRKFSRMYSLFGSPSASAERSQGLTSCGLSDKVLKTSPMYVCGDKLVILVSNSRSVGRSKYRPLAAGKKELCGCLCFSLRDGHFYESHPILEHTSSSSAISKAFPPTDIGVGYDNVLHKIFTLYENQLDLWGCQATSEHHVYLMSCLESATKDLKVEVSIATIMEILLYYLGIEACRHRPAKVVESSLHLTQIQQLFTFYMKSQNFSILYAIVAFLKGQLVANASHMSTLPEMATLRSELWGLLQSAEQCQPLKGLLESLFCDHFADLYSPSERNDIFMQVIEKSKHESDRWSNFLSKLLWSLSDDGHLVECKEDLFRALLDLSSVSLTLTGNEDSLNKEFSASLKAAFSMLCAALQHLVMSEERVLAEKFISITFEESAKWLSEIQDAKDTAKTVPQLPLLLPLLVSTLLSTPDLLPMATMEGLLPSLLRLSKLTGDVCNQLYGSDEVKGHSMPTPWSKGKSLESIHPVFDQYKLEQTVSFPGAKQLYLKFDERCSSQYDYDKVVLYAGRSVSSRKVCEYGGNTLGCGNNTVLAGGWPKEAVIVEGDSVTTSFHMKSSRERNTSDEAVWGFAFTVTAHQVDFKRSEGGSSLPVLHKLHLSLLTASSRAIELLFNGPPISELERSMEEFLQSDLLKRCQWNEEVFRTALVHNPLPEAVISKLRLQASAPTATLRPSIQQTIRATEIEELIVSAAIQHLGLNPAIKLIGEEHNNSTSHLSHMFHSINALLRRLQVLAELEVTWYHDVEDISTGEMDISNASFYSFLQQESAQKSFELLCLLKDVNLTECDLFTAAKQLQNLMEGDVTALKRDGRINNVTPRTTLIVESIIAKCRLLLRVQAPSQLPATDQAPPPSQQSATYKGGFPTIYHRFLSAPPTSLHWKPLLHRTISPERNLLQFSDKSDSVQLGDMMSQIMAFLSTQTMVTADRFLEAAHSQWVRGVQRRRALRLMVELLETSPTPLGLKEIVHLIGQTLKDGIRVNELSCSGAIEAVREEFGEVFQHLVSMATKHPVQFIDVIALLCCIDYQRVDENCLLRSGVLKMLEQLCDPVTFLDKLELSDEEEEHTRVVAWGAFRVLSSCCVSWEDGRSNVASSGLARQVSRILTVHLTKAIDQWNPEDILSCDPLQDTLAVLLGLSKTEMGRDVLSQPVCISQLLSLLVQKRPSPQMVLVILKLCRVALPLMNLSDCSSITLPPHTSLQRKEKSMVRKIVKLILLTLAEYLVVGGVNELVSASQEEESEEEEAESSVPTPLSSRIPTDLTEGCGRVSVYLHKRLDQRASDVIRPLLRQDPKQFRSSLLSNIANNVAQVMQMDKALTKHGKTQVFVDEKTHALRKALHWVALGNVVSVGPPSDILMTVGGTSDEKLAKAESECKDLNLEFSKGNPPRPFLSGEVAYSLVGEIISLLGDLMKEQSAENVWGTAIKQVLTEVLSEAVTFLPQLRSYVATVTAAMETASELPPLSPLHQSASLLNAALAVVGGFKQPLTKGSYVQIKGAEFDGCYGNITSLLEERGIACVQLEKDPFSFTPKETVELPISRLSNSNTYSLPVTDVPLQRILVKLILELLSCEGPIHQVAPPNMSGMDWALATCRLLAELRARAAKVLATQIKAHPDVWFVSDEMCAVITKCAETCRVGCIQSVVERHCRQLRMLYRDAFRPQPPKAKKKEDKLLQFEVDVTRSWPPPHNCLLAQDMKLICYYGNTSSESVPGLTLLTKTGIPSGAMSFYWECHLVALGVAKDKEVAVIMGLTPKPPAVKPANVSTFAIPVGSCIIDSCGKAVYHCHGDESSWKKVCVSESPLESQDVLGCGWVRAEEDGCHVAYFTLNGKKVTEFHSVSSGLYPFIQINRKDVKVRLNFGDHAFVFGDGAKHREGANQCTYWDVTVINRELPFPPRDSDVEEEEEEPPTQKKEKSPSEEAKTEVIEIQKEPEVSNDIWLAEPSVPHCTKDVKISGYRKSIYHPAVMTTSYNTMLETTSLLDTPISRDAIEESAPVKVEGSKEDPYELLVNAWETKVFPIIKQRFRNDQERKEGQEQIKGALRLGMEDIARQTVEFLYEDVGRLPKELTFPTLEDVKVLAEKLSAEKLAKNQLVIVSDKTPVANCGVRLMEKTLGLMGVILEIDEKTQVARVECYLPSDAVLVSFWYPISYLEKPQLRHSSSPILQATDAMHIGVHRRLLECECELTNLYCREALLELNSLMDSKRRLLLLSEHQFNESLPQTLLMEDSPHQVLNGLASSACHFFFKDSSRLFEELIKLSEEELTELLQLMHSSELNYETVSIPLNQENTGGNVDLTPAAFIMVNVNAHTPLPSNLEGKVKARVFCYHGNRGKYGRLKLQEVISYPYTKHSVKFPPFLLPGNLVYVQVSLNGSEGLDATLNLHGIPREIPLGLSVIESILVRDSPSKLLLKTSLSVLTKLLVEYNHPIQLKEVIFHLMSTILARLPKECDFPKELYNTLLEEVQELYECEVKSFGSETVTFPCKESICQSGHGRFSTYLQGLTELCHALLPLQPKDEEPVTSNLASKDGRFSVHEVPTRRLSRPFPVKSLSCNDGDVTSQLSSQAAGSTWFHVVHDTLSAIKDVADNEEIYLQDLEEGLAILPYTRLLVITGISSAEATDAMQNLADQFGGYYRNTTFVAEDGIVVEMSHSRNAVLFKSALFECPSLKPKQEAAELRVFSVDSDLCSEDETANRVLKQFLSSLLSEEGLEMLHSDLQRGQMGVVKLLFGEDAEEVRKMEKDKFLEKVKSQPICQIWKALLLCGIDFHFDKCFTLSLCGTMLQARALVSYLDGLSRNINVQPSQMEPWDVDIKQELLIAPDLHPLQGVSLGEVRGLFLALRWLNLNILNILPLIDLRTDNRHSLSHLIQGLSPYLFFDSKMMFFHRVINSSAHRSEEQAPPEVKLNPLEVLEAPSDSVKDTHFCQTVLHLLSIPASHLRVGLAARGDPTFAFNVKMVGDEVLGTSGSFRQYIGQVVRELHSHQLQILMPCPSSATGTNKDKYLLSPGPLTVSMEKLLIFFGQLLGVILRADIPVPLDLLACVWKALLGQPLSDDDLKEADILTFMYTENILKAASDDELNSILNAQNENETFFVVQKSNGEVVELCEGGSHIKVSTSNKERFVRYLRDHHLKELLCETRSKLIRSGLATVIPIEVLKLMTADDLSLRLCGIPQINLSFLKLHTIYQRGISEQDNHVKYFWKALHSFSQDDLRKFVKFACNQERIPFTNPNRDEDQGRIVHVPPYPMIIAPAQEKGKADLRFIRAETCMFMVKLPKYSSYDVMRDRLRHAINFRDDPLIG